MFMQSAAMALGFGSFFQYGKRKISSMSNDEFNALTPEALTSQLLSNVNNMIPPVQDSFRQMEQMNVMILAAMAKYFEQGIDYLEKWIQGGVHNLQHNVGDPIDEFIDSGGQLLPGAYGDSGLPEAPAVPEVPIVDTIKYNTIENYALRFITRTKGGGWKVNVKTPTLAEINWLLTESSKGNMPNIPNSILVSLSKREKIARPLPPTQKQTQQVIQKKSSGVVQQIASMYSNLTFLLAKWSKLKKSRDSKAIPLKKQWLKDASLYNQFVAQNRKPNLQIDTRLTLIHHRMTPK